MKTIYPNFKNLSTGLISKQIDDKRLEIFETDKYEINEYEDGCGVALLEFTEYNDWNEPILTHQHYDPICLFKETDTHYEFWNGGYERSVEKHGTPIFYKFIEEFQ